MFELVIILVCSICIFALIGVFTFLKWIFNSTPRTLPPGQSPSSRVKTIPTVTSDLAAANRLVEHLHSIKEIDSQEFLRLRKLLNQPFSKSLDLQESASFSATKRVQEQVARQRKQPAHKPPVLEPETGRQETIVQADVVTPSKLAAATPLASTVFAQDVAQDIPVPVPLAAASAVTKNASNESSVKPAPWDLPDPPAAPPRRTFGELMAGFMEEKNMRWGELTSGILIVLSAVGLVVSLREQLRNTIPYFSSLLFLLLTAAIHGAGIYTLRKWNLRNTSRGALVIGLLLIPLNFVAACVLSGGAGDEMRRSISDPWLWFAVCIGLSGLSVLAWHSSKHLFRRGHLPMVVALIGCGIGTLLLGRLIETTTSSVWYLVYSLPVLVSFLVGTCMFDPRQWQRTRWSERSANRLYLFLGITTFAALAASSMVIVRGESMLFAVVALTPIASVICIVTSWLGSILKNSSREDVAQRMTGLTLEILGMILLGMSLVVSLSNPITFLINSTLGGGGLLAVFIHQQNEKRIGIAWAVLSMALLAGLNLAVGKFAIDHWTSLEEIQTAILNGKSGLCLLASGVSVVAFHAAARKHWADPQRQESFMLTGWFTGASLLLAGCLIALVASLVNRDNIFDVMTASSLLGLASIGSVVAAIFSQKWKFQIPGLAHVAGALLLAALAHGLLWNPTVADFAARFSRGNGLVSWVGVVIAHGLVMGGVATWIAWRDSTWSAKDQAGMSSKMASEFGAWSSATTFVGSIGMFVLVPTQSGWATAFAIIASLSWYLIGWTFFQANGGKENSASSLFVLSTGLIICVCISELATRFAWCPELASPDHWLIQAIGLAIWSSAWTIFLVVLKQTDASTKLFHLGWLKSNKFRIELCVLLGIVFVIAGLITIQMYLGSSQEFFRISKSLDPVFAIGLAWVYPALAVAAIGILISTIEKPTAYKGAALMAIWLLAWTIGADTFANSKSVASGVRWLLPIGGAIGATLLAGRRRFLPAWSAARNGLDLSGPSRWSAKSTQTLINLALAIVAGIVILISTITVSQVLLNGVETLGGPSTDSWFKRMPAEISFGIPVAIVVGTFLLLAISERRSLLATLGSMVFQYVVLLAVVLLFLSPHPKLASSWFINILQSVSLGMTAYGFVWWWMRSQIERSPADQKAISGLFSQLETHTLINGVLITSLAALVMGRFYLFPSQPGDWISSVGSLLGILAWAAFGGLGFVVWRGRIGSIGSGTQGDFAAKDTAMPIQLSTFAVNSLVGWMGLVLIALLAAVVDRNFSGESFAPWLSFKVIAMGSIVVAVLQMILLKTLMRSREQAGSQTVRSLKNAWPMMLVLAVGLAFAVRGSLSDPSTFWLYFALMGSCAAVVMGMGWLLRAARFGFVSAAVAVAGSTVLILRDPHGWFTQTQPYWLNSTAIAIGSIAILWTAFYVYRRKSNHEPNNRSFVSMPNVVMLLGSIWIFVAGLIQVPIDAGLLGGAASSLANPLGVGAFVVMLILTIVMAWSDRAKFQLVCCCLISMTAMLVVVSGLLSGSRRQFEAMLELRFVAVTFSTSLVVLAWGVVWFNRRKLSEFGRQLGQTRLVAFERSVSRQLPIYCLIVGSVILVCSLVAIFNAEVRLLRYLTAAIPFALALSVALQSNPNSRRWLQVLSLAIGTVGVLFLAWADLTPQEIGSPPIVLLLIRTLIVLAGLMFVYGGLVTRWVRPGDTWLKTLREMAVWTCGLAIVCFVFVLASEASAFTLEGGCGLGIAESAAVTVLVFGMVVGLITIAVRPENDPFSLTLEGRMGYVFAAEAVAAGLAAHVYLSMPWLFQFGIFEYWPYIMMAICFGGVGVARVLESRNLVVLGQPLFQTAAIIPLIVAGGIFAVHSKSDAAMVMLTVGMAYLTIGYIRQSKLSSAGAVVFATIALWIFLESRLSFFEHPQLWLIPPAVAVLIAGQLIRKTLDSQQLAALRYVCVAIIYVSSTSEIFINGVGDKLWPPIVLAVLAVLGIMSGIMFQVKSYLYFGSLFLLLAMITMVAHAHQRLEHVWPWWAFGIGLGIAILVMFGLFEKRKNEMNAIANRLKEWEA